MITRTFLPVAALFAALTLPIQTHAQSANVKTPNKNQSAKFKSIIVKGSGNLIQSNATASFIGGGQSNTITLGVTNATVVGGFANTVGAILGTVGGGVSNKNSGAYSTIGGGSSNAIAFGSAFVTLGGGLENAAVNSYATVAGGAYNRADGLTSAIGGGAFNTNSGWRSTIGGGVSNKITANGEHATVPGGSLNTANGHHTFAAGTRANAINDNSFVWGGDDSEDTQSFAAKTFTVRAEGGFRFYTASGLATGAKLPAGLSSWDVLSDSNAKTKFKPVSPREVLTKIAKLPVTEWEYKSAPQRRFYGPMAQDFHAAFDLGSDEKTINTLDADGVLFLSVKGLVEELKERDEAIKELQSELHAVKQRLDSLPPAP